MAYAGKPSTPEITAAPALSGPPGAPAAYPHFPQAREKYGERAEKYASYLTRTDPLAAEVVEDFGKMPRGEGQRMLLHALDHGIATLSDTPASLRALFAQVDDVPFWVDWPQLDLGGYTFLRCRLAFVVLACLSLPLIYSLPAGNKPLVFSGRLVHMAAPRLKETVRFVLATCRKGGLQRHSEGFKLTLRVRLIHAQIRRLLRESGRWDAEAWGAPINQCHLAGTNVLFSQGVLDGLRRMGYRFTRRDAEALLQLWRYSGYLSGIQTELLPTSEAEARRLREVLFSMEGPPDEDSRALVQGVMEAALAYVRHGSPEICYGISRALIGRERAEALHYPQTGWRFLIPALRPFVTAVEISRQLNVPGVRALAAVCGTQMLRHLMSDRGLPGEMGDFVLPEHLGGYTEEPEDS